MEIAEKIGLVLLGVILSVIVYLFKRRVENKPQFEELDKHKKLLDIHKQMNDQGIDPEGLKQLEAIITGKASAIQSNAVALQSESTPLIEESDDENLTQYELNDRASRKLGIAKQKMQKAIAGIDSRVGDSESQSLMNSQNEWERYSVSQAEAAASSYQGGTIHSLIYASELESLTNERTARLQAELGEIIGLQGHGIYSDGDACPNCETSGVKFTNWGPGPFGSSNAWFQCQNCHHKFQTQESAGDN